MRQRRTQLLNKIVCIPPAMQQNSGFKGSTDKYVDLSCFTTPCSDSHRFFNRTERSERNSMPIKSKSKVKMKIELSKRHQRKTVNENSFTQFSG